MEENMNRVYFEISNCTKCPFSHQSSIITADSFEHETGIFCTKVEDDSGDWSHHTCDGHTPYRLIVADEWNARQYAKVPDWCPFIISQLKEIYKGILNSPTYLDRMNITNYLLGSSIKNGSDHGLNHAKRIIDYGLDFIAQVSDAFGYYNPKFYCSEKDL